MRRSTPSSDAKSVPDRLYVHIDRPDGVHLVGEMRFDQTVIGGFSARFRYARGWLDDAARRFPLDPINLPLTGAPQWVESGDKYLKLGVLFDAGPDMWGRQVVRHRTGIAHPAEAAMLLMGRGNGVGALLFSTRPDLKREDLPGFDTLPTIENDLERVHQAAHNVFQTTPMPEDLQGLLAGSWSIGGARAKAVMRDRDNRIWICKLSEPGSTIDRQRVEYANLRMAAAVGLEVPEVHLVETELGSVLQVRRFDRTDDLQRLHYLSAISLVSAVPEDKRLSTARDQRVFSYANLAHIVSAVSSDPVHDRVSIFARMALNVAVRNTDDHLKNTGFIESESAGLKRLRLSPVFDVVTQASSHHYLRIGTGGRLGTMDNVLTETGYFKLTERGARAIVDKVVHVVAHRHQFYEEAGLTGRDIDALDALLEHIVPAAADEREIELPQVQGDAPVGG
ncbi:type II toxin-antitoxin system HipA family toxin [Variovorax gossypii]